MFSVSGTTISLSRGDTGALRMYANATRRDTETAFTFGDGDRAVFSIKNSAGQYERQKAYQLHNNSFIVVFTNQDTENLSPGNYSWDVRYVINPYYEAADGDEEWTPYDELTFPVAKNTRCLYNRTRYVANQQISSSEAWTAEHWDYSDNRMPIDGDQVITPNLPMTVTLFTVVGEV